MTGPTKGSTRAFARGWPECELLDTLAAAHTLATISEATVSDFNNQFSSAKTSNILDFNIKIELLKVG